MLPIQRRRSRNRFWTISIKLSWIGNLEEPVKLSLLRLRAVLLEAELVALLTLDDVAALLVLAPPNVDDLVGDDDDDDDDFDVDVDGANPEAPVVFLRELPPFLADDMMLMNLE